MCPLYLIRRPQFVEINLPQQTLLGDIGKRGIDHFQLAVPESAHRLAIDRNVIRKLFCQFVQILGGAIVADTVAMQFIGDFAAELQTPTGVVLEIRHAFDDMPMPSEGELLENIKMMANEGFAVQNNREEMNGERISDASENGIAVLTRQFSAIRS